MHLNELVWVATLFLILSGCAQKESYAPSNIPEDADLPVEISDIESLCSITIDDVSVSEFPGNVEIYNYKAPGGEYLYIFYKGGSGITADFPRRMLEEDGISYEEIEFEQGGFYYEKDVSMSGGPDRTLFFDFVSNNTMYTIRAYSKSGHDEPAHCVSKEGLIALAEKYVEGID